MTSSVIADAKFQELKCSFTFQQLQDKLLIDLQLDSGTYRAEAIFHPSLDFEEVKDALLSKQFKILSKTPEIVKIKVGFLNLQFENSEHKNMHELLQTISDLKDQMKNQVQKNKFLEQTTHQLRTDLDSITTKLADINQKLDQNEKYQSTLKQELIKSNQNFAQLSTAVDRLNQSNYKLSQQIDSQKKEIALLNTQNQLLNKVRRQETQKLVSVESNIISTNKRISQLEKTNLQFQKSKTEQKSRMDSLEQNINSEKQKINQLKKNVSENISNIALLGSKTCYFSKKYKANPFQIFLGNNKKIRKTKKSQENEQKFALVEGLMMRKGSSIRFKIDKLVDFIGVGLAIRDVIIKNEYGIEGYKKPGHGSFLLQNNFHSYCHSHEKHNSVKTDLNFSEGDIVRIETNDTELIFVNQTQKNVFKMEIYLNENQWKESCFCVVMHSEGNTVQIV